MWLLYNGASSTTSSDDVWMSLLQHQNGELSRQQRLYQEVQHGMLQGLIHSDAIREGNTEESFDGSDHDTEASGEHDSSDEWGSITDERDNDDDDDSDDDEDEDDHNSSTDNQSSTDEVEDGSVWSSTANFAKTLSIEKSWKPNESYKKMTIMNLKGSWDMQLKTKISDAKSH